MSGIQIPVLKDTRMRFTLGGILSILKDDLKIVQLHSSDRRKPRAVLIQGLQVAGGPQFCGGGVAQMAGVPEESRSQRRRSVPRGAVPAFTAFFFLSLQGASSSKSTVRPELSVHGSFCALEAHAGFLCVRWPVS